MKRKSKVPVECRARKLLAKVRRLHAEFCDIRDNDGYDEHVAAAEQNWMTARNSLLGLVPALLDRIEELSKPKENPC